MGWLELTQEVDEESAEAVVELFSRYCRGSAVVEQQVGTEDGGEPLPNPVTRIRAYLAPSDDQVEVLLRIQQGLWHLSQIHPLPDLQIVRLEDKDWEHAWQDHYHVLRIGRRIVIRPSWRTYEPLPDDIVITLDPGMAFGTGLHPSTQLCVQALEDAIRPGMSVLDMGTGSGILAIAAALLGAARVTAIDNDPIAVKAATENVLANGMRNRIDVRLGSVEAVSGEFDLIVVNILAHVIQEMLAQDLARHLRPGGPFIAAGILQTQADDLERSFAVHSLRLVEKRQDKDWVLLWAEKARE
ncbi:MAG: 50S ribosomal protein L11 methyltransferase [Chloroflexi bacterium]|nr:50S ribosomal protein L11 methyltransferase [Chloroflexota bacterium]